IALSSHISSPAKMFGYSLSIPMQEPDGATTNSESEKAFIICFMAFFDWRVYPLLNAGCPQHVCFSGKSTSHPAFSSISTVAFPMFAWNISHKHVMNNETLFTMSTSSNILASSPCHASGNTFVRIKLISNEFYLAGGYFFRFKKNLIGLEL